MSQISWAHAISKFSAKKVILHRDYTYHLLRCVSQHSNFTVQYSSCCRHVQSKQQFLPICCTLCHFCLFVSLFWLFFWIWICFSFSFRINGLLLFVCGQTVGVHEVWDCSLSPQRSKRNSRWESHLGWCNFQVVNDFIQRHKSLYFQTTKRNNNEPNSQSCNILILTLHTNTTKWWSTADTQQDSFLQHFILVRVCYKF